MTRQNRIDPTQNPLVYADGSNQMNSKDIFNQRLKYNEYIFPDLLTNNFVRTWTEDRFYGTINTNGVSVLPDLRRLKSLQFAQEGEANQYALDFVADAWYDFALRLRQLADNNIIYRDSPWARPFVQKAWVSVSDQYDEYMRGTIYPAFYDQFMREDGNNTKVRNVGSFIDVLGDFVKNILVQSGPVTLSGLVESQRMPVYASGLVIEIAPDAYDDDFNKAYKFGDANFTFVANLAAQYGFAVDKNIPWRLVADLRNPAMIEYMLGVPLEGFTMDDNINYTCEPLVGDVELPPLAYGFSQIPGLEDVVRHVATYKYEKPDGQSAFEPGYRRYKVESAGGWIPAFNPSSPYETFTSLYDQDFTETWKSDIQIFEKYLLDFYNYYVTLRPTELIQKLGDPSSDCPPINVSIQRNQITEDDFKALYSERWKLKTFYIVRAMERNYDIGLKRRVYELIRSYDPDGAYLAALEIIQREYIGPADIDPLTLDTVGDIINPE
jgi:hypothetical protein